MPTSALAAYDALAPAYDAFTEGYDHERWLDRLEAVAREHGLRGRAVLDVACGTGKSALPLLRRGYAVTACDISPEMARIARERLGEEAEVLVADMRELPAGLGPFDLVTCLDDALNYLGGTDDLTAAFAAVARVLAPGGLYVFDVNTLAAYRQAGDAVSERGDAVFCWRTEAAAPIRAGGRFRAQLDAFVRQGDGSWRRTTSRHEQRHFADGEVRACLRRARLACRCVLGQAPGVRLDAEPDEAVHHKRVYVAARADR